jgi:DNA processing protein
LLNERPGGLTWAELTAEVVAEGSALAVRERLVPLTLMPDKGSDAPLSEAERQVEAWRTEGLHFLTVLDTDYPTRLRGVHQAPPILFGRGELRPDDPAISVVGSRRASDRGRQIAADVATALTRDELTVLSGLAAGIDATAHRAALASGGRTVAVIGTGIRKYYPTENRALQDEIAAKGLVLSQFWPDAPPRKQTFPMHNATMSGYGLATVVIEAGEISGARIQARVAVEHGRPVILSDLVVERNDWAKALVGRPGVHVASGIVDVMSIVRDLVAERGVIENALAHLATA